GGRRSRALTASRSGLVRRLVLALALATVGGARADLILSQGGEWHTEAKVTATVCVLGRCNSQRAQDDTVVFLPSGSLVRMEVQLWACDIKLGDYGEFISGKRGRVKLRHVDRQQLAATLRGCSPYPSIQLTKVAGSERLAPE